MDDEYILTYFYGVSHKRLNKAKLVNIPNDILIYLNNRYNDSTCIEETLQRIKLNYNEHPICVCGKPCKYVGGTRFFLNSCGCDDCAKKINQLHLQNTCLSKYGVTNPAKNTNTKYKQKETCLQRYGEVSALLNEIVHNKTVQTNIERYGVKHPQSSDIIKQKISYSNHKTCMTRYKVKNIMQVKNVYEKYKQTLLDKYKVDNIAKLQNIQNTIQEKRINTLKEHNTFNTSSIEQQLKEYFDEHNINYKYQYKDDRYPYCCDFYFPDTDLFVEIQGSWAHGFKPYENTDKDKNVLEKWCNKSSKYYDNAIETWTVRDVKKRETAKQNKLNYLEIFSMDLTVCLKMLHNKLR